MFEKPLIHEIQKLIIHAEQLNTSGAYQDPQIISALQDVHKSASKAGMLIIEHLMQQETDHQPIVLKKKRHARSP
jgi:hypothetical protein